MLPAFLARPCSPSALDTTAPAYLQFCELEDQYACYHTDSGYSVSSRSVPPLQLHAMKDTATANLTSRFALNPEHVHDGDEATEQALIELVKAVFDLFDRDGAGLVPKRCVINASISCRGVWADLSGPPVSSCRSSVTSQNCVFSSA